MEVNIHDSALISYTREDDYNIKDDEHGKDSVIGVLKTLI